VGKRKENQEFNDSYIEPTEFVFSKGEPVKVVCGQSFSLILTKQNHVWSWGIDNSGSLGLGSCEGDQTNFKS
jgi:alpha-tubulin suppressor-like RCC1 family protein